MELEKLRGLSGEDARSELARTAEQLFRIRFAKSLGKSEGVSKIRSLKKDIARMQTISREREIAHQKAGN